MVSGQSHGSSRGRGERPVVVAHQLPGLLEGGLQFSKLVDDAVLIGEVHGERIDGGIAVVDARVVLAGAHLEVPLLEVLAHVHCRAGTDEVDVQGAW